MQYQKTPNELNVFSDFWNQRLDSEQSQHLQRSEMVLPSDLPFYSKEVKVEYAMAPQVIVGTSLLNELPCSSGADCLGGRGAHGTGGHDRGWEAGRVVGGPG